MIVVFFRGGKPKSIILLLTCAIELIEHQIVSKLLSLVQGADNCNLSL